MGVGGRSEEERQAIAKAVLSREEETLTSSVDGCQVEEGGTLKADILEEVLKDFVGCWRRPPLQRSARLSSSVVAVCGTGDKIGPEMWKALDHTELS